ncbi:hypothetical protein Cgig2_028014 [Carnegiea gigantea]|uniref:Ubiquitin-like protease family profile domain-containing protein n=1 Tax=Carnegiea gigantea TaxID=171969 RepID=A0A9Q1JPU4_9CARY|nr:hypothetical protein Cgig2_028014 [Carnegiea gigantea]
MGEASVAVGKRKRRMSGAKLGSGDAPVSKIGEGVSGSRHINKDGKGKGKREGKHLTEEVDGGKGRNGKGREKGNVAGDGGAGVGAWDRRRKAFRIAGREVRFTVFDVVLFTGLPGTRKKVELDREEVSTEVGDMVRARMGEWERKEMARRVPRKSGKKRRFFKHYVNVMMELCEENAQEDRVGIWLRLYAFIVLSGVLFPRSPYGGAWSLLRYVDDVEGIGQYAWADAVWQVVVDSIEDTHRKLCRGPLSEVQLNGLCLLIQVWFYKHTTIFSNQDGERYPRLASWRKVDHGGMYDATELLAELQESEGVLSFDERLRHAREAYAKEKEANRRIRAEFVVMKNRLLELEGRLQEFGAGHGDVGRGQKPQLGQHSVGQHRRWGQANPVASVVQRHRTPGDSGNGQNVPTFATEADVQSEPAVEGANERYEQARPADIGDSGIASAAQAVHSPAEMAAEDANSVPPTTDSVPVSDGDVVKVNQPSIAGDRGHCHTTSTTTTAADVPSCPRSSNIVSRMKKLPRLRQPSRVRGSPYTNPMRGIKGGRKGLKSTASVQTGSGDRSPSTVQGEIVNDEDVSSVVPIAVERGDGEVDAHAHPDAAVKDDVPDTSTFGPSPHVPAPRTRGTGSTFVISEEGVKAYLTWPLSPTEVDLLVAIRARCKGLKDSQWNFDLPETSEKHVNAEFLKGLINVVPTRGAADRPGRCCIGAFVVHLYCKLLHLCQRQHKRYCRMSAFLDRHDQGMLSRLEQAAGDIWKTLKAHQHSNLCYNQLLRALMKLAAFTDVLRWEMEHADCPQQDNGHDYGVYMLMFMDLLSIRADGVYFGQNYMRHARDKLLLSLLQGSIAHFPQAFLQGT